MGELRQKWRTSFRYKGYSPPLELLGKQRYLGLQHSWLTVLLIIIAPGIPFAQYGNPGHIHTVSGIQSSRRFPYDYLATDKRTLPIFYFKEESKDEMRIDSCFPISGHHCHLCDSFFPLLYGALSERDLSVVYKSLPTGSSKPAIASLFEEFFDHYPLFEPSFQCQKESWTHQIHTWKAWAGIKLGLSSCSTYSKC